MPTGSDGDLGVCIANGGEGLCLQRGATHQEAINVLLACQLCRILVIHRAAYICNATGVKGLAVSCAGFYLQFTYKIP